MNRLIQSLILLSGLLITISVAAQDRSETATQPVQNQMLKKKMVAQQENKAEAARQEALAEARQRLEQAAREVAELSGQVYGQAGGNAFFIRDLPPPGQPRAMLGLNIFGVQGDGNSNGVKILGVSPDSPADKAGLQAGDIVTSIDGKTLTGASSAESSATLLDHMAEIEPGKTVTLEYTRDGKKHKVDIKTAAVTLNLFPRIGAVAAAPAAPVHLDVPFFGGPFAGQWGNLALAGLTPGLGKYFGTEEGVLVVRAPSDENMKLEDGDVILNIDGRKPNDPEHALRILRSYATGEKLTIEVMRDKRHHKLEMTVPEGNNANFMYRNAPGAMTAPAAPQMKSFMLQRQPPVPTKPVPPVHPGENTPI